MITEFYYNEQIKKWLVQFGNVFTDMKIKTGKRSDNITEFDVPIKYASTDRVVSAISNRNTQNMLLQLPMMSFYLVSINYAPDREHGKGMVDRKTILEYGDVFPNDLKVAEKQMPIPYNIEVELTIYTSNTEQMFQIMEQILLVFDPDLQLQKTDAFHAWDKITKLTLLNTSNIENVPIGSDKRVIQWKLNFELPIWLSAPMNYKNNVIKTIIARVGTGELDELNPEEPFTPPICEEPACNNTEGCMPNGYGLTIIKGPTE